MSARLEQKADPLTRIGPAAPRIANRDLVTPQTDAISARTQAFYAWFRERYGCDYRAAPQDFRIEHMLHGAIPEHLHRWCGKCAHFNELYSWEGECRANAPRARSRWPRVRRTQWCAKFAKNGARA